METTRNFCRISVLSGRFPVKMILVDCERWSGIAIMKKKNALKSLTKLELLELLAEQEREIQSLQQELEQKEQLIQQRTLCMMQSGNIAQAALALNGVFEAAQMAADQYIESVKAMTDCQCKETRTTTVLPNSAQPSIEKKIPQSPVDDWDIFLSDILRDIEEPYKWEGDA